VLSDRMAEFQAGLRSTAQAKGEALRARLRVQRTDADLAPPSDATGKGNEL
jgi:hypothetical protein